MASLRGGLVAVTALIPSLFISFVTAVPSPNAIGSDITILIHNDLYGNTSTKQDAVIVLSTPQSHAEAVKRCAAIGETLWSPHITPNTTSNLNFLRYLDHNKPTDDVGRYWISPATCQTIDTHGHIRDEESCDFQYPALCSQSASLSSPSIVDTGPRWQTSVRTGNATVLGYRDKLSFRFLGIRFGSIPARFEYSTYAPPSGNVSALAYGPTCVQSGCTETTCSEACLYLNIWTPYLPHGRRASPQKKKAVMLWIHGGGFTGGQGSDTTFDGGNLASRGDVVVVTINYRLSTLGFLALGNNTAVKGNYGIADQIVALDWVQRHIEDFGGDKDRITVFGQSAGAASVRALLASSQATSKFSGAIMQSNPAGLQYAETFSRYLTIEEAAQRSKGLLNETGCTQADSREQLACLRALPASKLVAGQSVARYPVVDGFYLTSDELPLNDSKHRTGVALLTGNMRDDGSPFSKFSTSSNASKALEEQGFDWSKILSSGQFPLPHSGNTTRDIFNLTSRVATDGMFRCLTQSTAIVGSYHNVFPVVYEYEIDRAYQISEWSPNPPACEAPKTAERPLGDVRLPYYRCHSGELYYVFGTLIRQGRQPRDQDDIPFSQFMVDTWTAFAREKDPNPKLDFLAARGYTNTSATVERSTRWKRVTVRSPEVRILDVKPRNEGLREMKQCEVLDLPLEYYGD